MVRMSAVGAVPVVRPNNNTAGNESKQDTMSGSASLMESGHRNNADTGWAPPLARRAVLAAAGLGLVLLLVWTGQNHSEHVRAFIGGHQWTPGHFERLPRPLSPVAHGDPSRWVVVTSIQKPTADVDVLCHLPGWNMVVVADKKTPKDWTPPAGGTCHFLSLEDQEGMGLSYHPFAPFRHYARKNIGYLYAIRRGATVIFDTDDDNVPVLRAVEPLASPAVYRAATVSNEAREADTRVANPYAYFGQPDVWPRGYPLEHLRFRTENATAAVASSGYDVPVQQGLADLDPDVDAIYRLVNRVRVGQIEFDTKQEPVVFPPGVFSPYNSQNTVVLHRAFWSLYLPSTVAMRVCDIWRSYWAQRLLWDIGSVVLFQKPTVKQIRNSHNYVLDLSDEVQMYEQAGNLVNGLARWVSNDAHLFDRAMSLCVFFAAGGFWDNAECNGMFAWFEDLTAAGYVPPSVVVHKH